MSGRIEGSRRHGPFDPYDAYTYPERVAASYSSVALWWSPK
jgi:hypothetical protein